MRVVRRSDHNAVHERKDIFDVLCSLGQQPVLSCESFSARNNRIDQRSNDNPRRSESTGNVQGSCDRPSANDTEAKQSLSQTNRPSLKLTVGLGYHIVLRAAKRRGLHAMSSFSSALTPVIRQHRRLAGATTAPLTV
jgi:hypothetical protein